MAFDPSTAQPVSGGGFDANSAQPVQQPDQGTDEGALFAALHGFEDTGTFGFGDKASAALAAGASHLLAGPNLSYDDALAKIKGNVDTTAAANPGTTIAGDVAGVVGGGGLLSAGARALKAVPIAGRVAAAAGDALKLRKGQPILNTLKSAAVGGGMGAADSIGHGGNEDQTLIGTATGAVLGPITGKVITSGIKALSPVATKALSLLADKIGETPETLQNLYNEWTNRVGRPPTMAEIVGLRSRGELRQVASGNPTIGEAVGQQEETPMAGQNVNDLVSARKARMDRSMDNIRDTAVPVNYDDLSMLSDRRVRAATNGDPVLQKKLNAVVNDIGDDPDAVSNRLTVDDIDAIRKSLRGRQSSYANPTNAAHNPHTAKSYGTLADNVAQLATDVEPRYGDALEQFGRDSDYLAGFKHGNSGKSVDDAERPELINSLNTIEGDNGYKAGRLQFTGRRNVGQVSPGVPKPADTGGGIGNAAHAVAAGTYHSPTAVAYHLSRVLPHVRMSDAVQRKVAQYLTDPQMTQQGINLLKQAGARNEDLRRLALVISGSAGANASQAIAGN